MADSDEEFDRRRRDKFRRERPEMRGSDDRRSGGNWDGDRGHRENWNSSSGGYNKDSNYKPGYKNYRTNDYNSSSRDRRGYSPSSSRHDNPPAKRQRRDWEDGGGGSFGGGGDFHNNSTGGGSSWGAGGDAAAGGSSFSAAANRSNENDFPTQPAMMLFKHFLAQQDDNITDEEAMKKYNEYKVEFRQTQLNEFFLAHKEEEWFKHKYQPDECIKRKAEEAMAVQKRADVYKKLMDSGKIASANCDMTKGDELVKLLDAAVILMEGGTDFDLGVLERPPPEVTAAIAAAAKAEEKEKQKDKEDVKADVIENGKSDKEDGEDDGEVKDEAEGKENGDNTKDGKEDEVMEEKEPEKETPPEEDEEERAKKEYFQPATPDMDAVASDIDKESPTKNAPETPTKETPEITEEMKIEEEPKKDVKVIRKRKRQYSNDSYSGSESSFTSSSSSSSDSDSDAETKDISKKEAQTRKDSEGDRDVKVEEEEEDGEPQPKALHKTKSIFLRNLAATITKQEVEAMCKRYPGFLRVSLQDPQPERRFLRRGWVTFDRTVNINNICWNLNNIRLRDCEMGAIVNRDLTGRVRPANAITAHKDVVRQDIKHAAKIIQNMDKRYGLWDPKKPEGDAANEQSEKKDAEKACPADEPMEFGLVSNNPILENIIDYLVEEGSYEEEAILGTISGASKTKESEEEGVAIERDEALIKVLDRMVLYLRIVHSYDYYTAVEYPNEDQMPHRCGMMHARANSNTRIAINDVQDWIGMFDHKCSIYVNAKHTLDDAEIKKLGMKDNESEVKRFITANTQELAKDKWLCPLSGKKFKGPEFVRKHILNKHAEKVEEVKAEVDYFNNYLRDPKRPQLPEHPGRASSRPAGAPGGGGGGRPDFSMGGSSYQSNPGSFHGGFNPRGGYGGGFRGRRPYNNSYQSSYQRRDSGFPRRRGGRDPRGVIEYRDLDAPDGDGDF